MAAHIVPAGCIQTLTSDVLGKCRIVPDKEAYNVYEAQKEDDLDDKEDARQHPCNLRRTPLIRMQWPAVPVPGIVAVQKQEMVCCSSAQRVSWGLGLHTCP